MYSLMESIKFNSFEEFVIMKVFAENHYNDNCFDEFRNMTLKDIAECGNNGNYLAKVFSNICWYYFT